MYSSPHWLVGSSWFREKLSPANREQWLSRWANFAQNCLPRIGSKVLPRFREKYLALGRQKMGSNMRPRYIQFRDIHDHDISGVHCIPVTNIHNFVPGQMSWKHFVKTFCWDLSIWLIQGSTMNINHRKVKSNLTVLQHFSYDIDKNCYFSYIFFMATRLMHSIGKPTSTHFHWVNIQQVVSVTLCMNLKM